MATSALIFSQCFEEFKGHLQVITGDMLLEIMSKAMLLSIVATHRPVFVRHFDRETVHFLPFHTRISIPHEIVELIRICAIVLV